MNSEDNITKTLMIRTLTVSEMTSLLLVSNIFRRYACSKGHYHWLFMIVDLR